MSDLFELKSVKTNKKIPYEFVIDHLASLKVRLKPMFGALAIYQNEKILFILREKDTNTEDNGVWVATIPEHHASLRDEFPSLRSIRVFGEKESSWQNLPADSSDFEETVARLCDLAVHGDLRIGKFPNAKKKKLAVPKAKKKKSKESSVKKPSAGKKTKNKSTPKKPGAKAAPKRKKKIGKKK